MNSFDIYRRNITDTNKALASLRKSINSNSFLRLGVIIGGGAALFMGVQSEKVWLVLVLFFAVILLFSGLVWRQSKLEAKKAVLLDFLAVNQNEIDIVDGKPNRYPNGESFRDGGHPYSEDLDVFGVSSLFALVNRSATVQANRLLATWLMAPADATTIAMRQQAVKELADDAGWCQQFQAKLWFNLEKHEDFRQQFARYLNDRNLTFGNTLLRMYVKVVPWLMGGLVGLAFFVPTCSSIAIFLAMIHVLAAVRYGGEVGRIAGKMDKTGQLLGAFAESFKLVESRKWESQLGMKLFLSLRSENGTKPISTVFKELATLIDRLDYRLNMLVGAVLNMVALWDFRQVFAILDWRAKYGVDILKAFDVVAEIEALGSLAALSRNHPQWAFPEVISATAPFVEASVLSHPLIPADKSVPNDYQMENHRVALITGSNMAGKSTFLRTVGSNAVLAFCGAPVHGEHMRVATFHLVTYMRIKDSLNESTSTFKAELDRIHMILQTVKSQPNTFFLIDEMLRGTNSMDKYLGSKAIIKQLVADGGVGMVATHDLQLAKLADEHPGIIANFHFDIQVRDDEMVFDYKLKPGECTIFNASLLLKNIGIHVNG
ncbi:MutS-related protein [Parapedobacter tibetensis]|uniref:MutS-related protein n=1 Tax=Parapedobacter tibetensis TaxID=2972951 RepID=UPI00214D20AF|nr:DNA mismatch repair protein MutS [Parapedobacter tibetensis]